MSSSQQQLPSSSLSSSSTFLSGEASSTSTLSSTLASISLNDRNGNRNRRGEVNNNNGNDNDNSISRSRSRSRSRSNKVSKTLIQVIDETTITSPTLIENDNDKEQSRPNRASTCCYQNENCLIGDGNGNNAYTVEDDDDDDDDDDGPPPFFEVLSNEVQKDTRKDLLIQKSAMCNTVPTTHCNNDMDSGSGNENSNNVNGNGNESSLMEKMMEDAIKAKKRREEKRNEKQKKESKKMSFGLKKGFLNSGAAPSNMKNNAKIRSKRATDNNNRIRTKLCGEGDMNKGISTCNRNENDDNDDTPPDIIYELDKDGNIHMLPTEEQHQPQRRNEKIPTIRPKGPKDANPFRLQEVQDAMINDLSSSSSSLLFNHLSNKEKEWNTPDLAEEISKNKILSLGMMNPKFTAALEAFKSNPKQALQQFRNHPDVVEFLNEFCRVMGNHFVKLDKKQNKGSVKNATEKNVMGPLAQKAVQKEQERKERGETSWDRGMSRQERERLDAIMADQELTSLLMDVDLQRAMNECSNLPGRMRMYMQHKDYGPKLKKLINAGLLQIA